MFNLNHAHADYQQQLSKAGLLGVGSHGEAGDPDSVLLDDRDLPLPISQGQTPWYISTMLGVSGLLAGGFLIGILSILLTDLLDSSAALFCLAGLMSAISLVIFQYNHLKSSVFLSSLAFAIGMAGQIYFFEGVWELSLSRPLMVSLVLLFQLTMTLIIPNHTYRFISGFIALDCLIYLLYYYNASELSAALLALIFAVTTLQRHQLLRHLPIDQSSTNYPITQSPADHPTLTISVVNQLWQRNWLAEALQITHALSYASGVLLLLISVLFIASEYNIIWGEKVFYYPLAQAMLILISLYSTYLILRRYQLSILSATGLLTSITIILLGVLSVYVSGLLATSLVIVIAVANSQRVLLGLGIIALVSYIFWYYYQLDTSLLLKSASMLIIGITLLLIRWLFIQRYLGHSADLHELNEETK